MLKCSDHSERKAFAKVAWWSLTGLYWYNRNEKGRPYCKECVDYHHKVYAEGKDPYWRSYIHPLIEVNLVVKKIII